MKIVIHAEHPEPLIHYLENAHPGHSIKSCNSYEDLPGLIADFQPEAVFTIRFAGTPGFPAEALTGRNGPKWIHVGGSGTDHLGSWDPDQTLVSNSAGVAAPAMAEYAIGAFLHFSLDISGLLNDQTNRVWSARSISVLKNKTLLIAGLGHTGRAIARLADAFGMRVIGTRANPRSTPHVAEVHPDTALQDLLPQADYIVVSVPLYEATRGLFDRLAFMKMKETAILVDLSRGGIICEAALIDALKNRKIGGAALDVFETEPLPADNPLWQLENVLVSPHCSSVFEGWEIASMEIFCNNLDRFQNGGTIENLVLPR